MNKKYSQLQLPDPADRDPHPRLLLDGYGIHAGMVSGPCSPTAGTTSPWR